MLKSCHKGVGSCTSWPYWSLLESCLRCGVTILSKYLRINQAKIKIKLEHSYSIHPPTPISQFLKYSHYYKEGINHDIIQNILQKLYNKAIYLQETLDCLSSTLNYDIIKTHPGNISTRPWYNLQKVDRPCKEKCLIKKPSLHKWYKYQLQNIETLCPIRHHHIAKSWHYYYIWMKRILHLIQFFKTRPVHPIQKNFIKS